MRILLRRWTTQFLVLEGGLEEDEPEPGVEEVEELEGQRERCLLSRKANLFVFPQIDIDTACRQPAGAADAERAGANVYAQLSLTPAQDARILN